MDPEGEKARPSCTKHVEHRVRMDGKRPDLTRSFIGLILVVVVMSLIDREACSLGDDSLTNWPKSIELMPWWRQT